MREFVVSSLVTVCCLALEVFLLSIGWNLSRTLFAGVPEMHLSEAVGLFVFFKIVGLQFRPPLRVTLPK
jgi:hypothetical protein